MNLQPKTIEALRNLIIQETRHISGMDLAVFFRNLGFQSEHGIMFSYPHQSFYIDSQLLDINGTPGMETCIKILFTPINFVERPAQLENMIAYLNKYLDFDEYKIVKDGKIIKITATDKDTQHETKTSPTTENEHLAKEIAGISVSSLKLDEKMTSVVEQRLAEIKKCLTSNAPLATIFLCGSALEGILLGVAMRNRKEFKSAEASIRGKDEKVSQLEDWSLAKLIDVAKKAGFLREDAKGFSHVLRDFRNYIHPLKQANKEFTPDEETAEMFLRVLRLAIDQISEKTAVEPLSNLLSGTTESLPNLLDTDAVTKLLSRPDE